MVSGKDMWVADSGASRSMTSYHDIIDDIHVLEKPVNFQILARR
jgi:hypothetical protein